MPRTSDKDPYGADANSVLANMNKLTKEQRAKYWKNRAVYYQDTAALERWAAEGFGPSMQSDYEEVSISAEDSS